MSKTLHGLLDLDESRLSTTLEQLLATAIGQQVRIDSLAREPNPFPGVFPAEVVSVRLECGQEARIHVKHLGSEHSDHPAKPSPELEVRVYETLLQGKGLPVVQFYGTQRNNETQRLELYLEHIDGWNLKHEHIDYWFAAARCLGELHAHFAERPNLLRKAFLPNLDADHLQVWANRALATIGTYRADLRDRLDGVVRSYDDAIPVLAGHPATLVHGDLSPKNVVVDKSLEPPRLLIVDWEHAMLGSGVVDLVHLKYGLSSEYGQRMCRAYSEAVQGTPLLPTSSDDLRLVMATAEIYHRLYMLARSRDRRYKIETVEERVADLERLASRL